MKDNRSHAMNLSLAAAVLMLVGKIVAYNISGSTAILSDAAESVVHIFATGIAAFSLWYASQPADREHPYGHGRIVSFSIGFEGALILAAAVVIFREAIHALVNGVELRDLGWGLIITGGLAIVNLFLGLYLIRTGKRSGSSVLVANGSHVLTDMWTSVAVVAGVFVVYVTGVTWLDPLIAIAAGILILVTGSNLIKSAISEAMDEAPAEETEKLRVVFELSVSKGFISGYHQLRHRRVNDARFIEVHMLVPEHLLVGEAHRRVSQVEKDVQAEFPNHRVSITSHIEPDDHHAAHPEGHDHDPLAPGDTASSKSH